MVIVETVILTELPIEHSSEYNTSTKTVKTT